MLFAVLTQKNWAQARIRSITDSNTVTLPKYSFDDLTLTAIGEVSMNEDQWLGL
ncbi:hypothetical protein CY0110_31825, partial [Crocosphaera chwakensis CCY0110]